MTVEDVALCHVEVAAPHEGLLHEVLNLLDARSVFEASLHVSEDRRKLLARGDGAPVRKGPGHGRDDLLAVIALHAPVPLHYVHGVSRLSLWNCRLVAVNDSKSVTFWVARRGAPDMIPSECRSGPR